MSYQFLVCLFSSSFRRSIVNFTKSKYSHRKFNRLLSLICNASDKAHLYIRIGGYILGIFLSMFGMGAKVDKDFINFLNYSSLALRHLIHTHSLGTRKKYAAFWKMHPSPLSPPIVAQSIGEKKFFFSARYLI